MSPTQDFFFKNSTNSDYGVINQQHVFAKTDLLANAQTTNAQESTSMPVKNQIGAAMTTGKQKVFCAKKKHTDSTSAVGVLNKCASIAGIANNLDTLPPGVTVDLFVPEDAFSTQSQQGDPLLFSVDHDQLQPITSPFLEPGIYKKIPHASAFQRSSIKDSVGNVFVSKKESCGRIIPTAEFPALYTCINERQTPHRVHAVAHCELATANTVPEIRASQFNEDKSQQWDSLSKLACYLNKHNYRDNIIIDRTHNQIVQTENGTHQQKVYRFLTPDTLQLKTQAEDCTLSRSNVPQTKGRLKPGRQRKQIGESVSTKRKQKPAENASQLTTATQPTMRTRSGRVVKVVQPPFSAVKANSATAANTENWTNFLHDLTDNDYRCTVAPARQTATGAATKPAPTPAHTPALIDNDNQNMPSSTASSPIKRRVPPEAVCPTCKKIFLGRRMQRHYAQHPDHMIVISVAENQESHQTTTVDAPTNANEELTLFRFLTAKLQKSHLNEDQRADLFLQEISDFVEQLQLRSSRLIRNTSGLHFVSARCARVLGIPEGQYALDISAIEAPPEPEPSGCENIGGNMLPAPTSVNTRSLDYTALSMSLDDTLTDEAAQKLNLSAGGKLLPPSEESLLRAVDDLVHEGIKKLSESNMLNQPVSSTVGGVSSTLVPHYDHASDNAVEALVPLKQTNAVAQSPTPLLDLTVDFFQFKNN